MTGASFSMGARRAGTWFFFWPSECGTDAAQRKHTQSLALDRNQDTKFATAVFFVVPGHLVTTVGGDTCFTAAGSGRLAHLKQHSALLLQETICLPVAKSPIWSRV